MKALVVFLLLARVAHADCPGNAIVTLDDGVIVNAEWPADKRAITNATLETTYTLDGDITAHAVDGKPSSAKLTIPADGVMWSDKLPSSLERIIAKARAGAKTVKLGATSKDVPPEARVESTDATDWSIAVGTRTYEVVTDDQGCLLAATLAPYGITFERRDLAPEAYPLEGAYTAPKGAPYTATDVKIAAPQGHTLAGTLTKPKRGGRVPAVVLITGISKHERNEGNPPFTPFRDIADVLGRAGIAVLRVDDRGVGASTGDFDKATSFDEADDVRTELAWLKKQPGIDPKRVGVIGHSEGGLIALVVGASDPSLAAIGVLAGSGVPGEQLNTWQTIQTVEHDPAVPAAKKADEIKKQLADRSDWTPRDTAFVATDPVDYAKKVKAPTLILQGSADLHVPPRSAERLQATMRAAGNRDVTVRVIPNVSHTLSPDAIGSLQGFGWLPSRRLSNQLLVSLRDFLVAKLKP